MREARSFCRTCIAQCGVIVSVDENERIARIRADDDHPISAGYACFKGLQAVGNHYGPGRLLHSLKRQPDGSFAPIRIEQALDEIAARLDALRMRDGAEAIGLFRGTAGFHNSTAFGMHGSFLAALGSPSLFTTLSIDQSAKGIAACRIGRWHAGPQHIEQSDVALMFGSNPLVSHSAGGFLVSDPVRRLKKAVARGLKVIVVDPRRSETARFAAIHLQPYPGEDVSVAAGLLHIILRNGWHDHGFCGRHVSGLEALRAAVAPYTPAMVATRAGVSADLLLAAAELFAVRSRSGGIHTGTGPNMAPRSNLAEHLIQCIGIVCGRFRRAGDAVVNADPMSPQHEWFAEVVPPCAPWDAVAPSRIRGVGNLFGEKLTGTLAEEITTPGKGQIRALIVNGANIANSVPGKGGIVAALRSLELLVVIDPHLTPTAQLADYVLAPRLQLERADLPITLGMSLHADAWTQFTPAIVPPPRGAEVVEDWYVFWSLARRMGLALSYAGTPLDMQQAPTSEHLLELGLRGTAVTLPQVMAQPGQVMVQPAGPAVVQPARPGATARLRLDGDDVLEELAVVAAEPSLARRQTPFPFRLIARRMRDVNGSIGMHTPQIRQRNPYNPLFLNPADMRRDGIQAGALVDVRSPDGQIRAVAHPDESLREGVASMSHGWGSLDDDPEACKIAGSSTNRLINCTTDFETLNAMPRMSAIPVAIAAAAETSRS